MDNTNEPETQEKVQRLLSRAYFYLRYRLRTRREMYAYLEGKASQYGYNTSIVDTAMEVLVQHNYINDYRFVELYIHSHQNVKQKSSFLLRNQLLQKGVPSTIIDSYLEKNPVDDTMLAIKALRKRWPRYIHLDRLKRFKKAHDFLRRNGFAYDVVKKTIEEMEEKR